MSREIEKRETKPTIGENAQYALAFGVIAVMLYVVGLPAFVIFFLGAFAFFLWKLFASGSASETRRIFEFYLIANEMLRSDDRRWFGFEIQDAIARGEKIVASMHTAPPLVHFALGCLLHKRGAHAAAIKHLEQVLEDSGTGETSIVFPSNELREYVRILRKIEREPAEAPQTSAAIRSLERLRKNKGMSILDQARHLVHEEVTPRLQPIAEKGDPRFLFEQNGHGDVQETGERSTEDRMPNEVKSNEVRESVTREQKSRDEVPGAFAGRKPIAELLQDIYDEKPSS